MGPTAELEQAAHDYGIAPGGRAMMLAEIEAADFSISTGVYVVWRTLKSGEGSVVMLRGEGDSQPMASMLSALPCALQVAPST